MISMDSRIGVALLFGGRSAEHEVSISSARAVYNNLDPARYRITCLFIDKAGRWRQVPSPHLDADALSRGLFHSFLAWDSPGRGLPSKADIFWPVLHGPYGEDGTIQGLLELADVPYVGAGVLGSAAGMDKAVMKDLFRTHGLPIVPHVAFGEADWRRSSKNILHRIRAAAKPPIFVKPANLGSSVGITKVKEWTALGPAIETALLYDRKVVVEQGVDCRELECAVLGNDDPEASPPAEIIPSSEFYTYADKYLDGKTGFVIPAKLPAAVEARVRRFAVEAFRACEGAGLARVDFFLEKGTRRLFVNEINSIPGFTEISMYPKLWAAAGIPFPRLVDRLIELGFERHRAKKRRVDRASR
jgi:D-alanine-D-alanine ligase